MDIGRRDLIMECPNVIVTRKRVCNSFIVRALLSIHSIT